MGEKREFVRAPVSADVRIRAVPEGESRRGRTKNISGSGILFSSSNWFEPGTLLYIEVLTPVHREFSHVFEPMRATVRVVRVEGEGPGYDVAAEFIRLTLP